MVCGPITRWVSAWRCFLTGEAFSLVVKRFWTLSLWSCRTNTALLRTRSTQNKLGCIWITDGEGKASEVSLERAQDLLTVLSSQWAEGFLWVEWGGKKKASKFPGTQMLSKGASHFVAENQNFWVLLLEVLLFFKMWKKKKKKKRSFCFIINSLSALLLYYTDSIHCILLFLPALPCSWISQDCWYLLKNLYFVFLSSCSSHFSCVLKFAPFLAIVWWGFKKIMSKQKSISHIYDGCTRT